MTKSIENKPGKTTQRIMQQKPKAPSPAQGSTAERMVRGFAEQLESMKSGLKEGEVVLLAMGEAGLSRAIHKIDLKVSGPDVIIATVTWLEGDVEQRIFNTNSFQPILTKESNSTIPDETRSLIEQVLGHLTAHGILYTQMIANKALETGDASTFLEAERTRAIEVVKGANISAAGMNGDEIRSKAMAVVNQTFDSIQVEGADVQTASRVLN